MSDCSILTTVTSNFPPFLHRNALADSGSHDGKRQLAFQASPYSDPEPVRLNIKVVREEEAAMRTEAEERRRVHERKLFLLGR